MQTRAVVSLNTGAIVLRDAQLPKARQALEALDFGAMPASDIVKLGLGAEQALQRTLDGFLSRLDKNTAAKVFDLFGRLEKGVEDARLPEILDRIQNGERPGFFQGLFAKLTGKSPDELVREFMEEVGALVSGRTKTLADQMQRLEGELSGEMQKLFSELKTLETLKQSYAGHFSEFTFDAAVARALLDKAKDYVASQEAAANAADPAEQSRMRELKDKLRLLESRALTLEGTYTRLPADQIVIQQIEQAGIATLQETATTIASRFASIKMTLLSLQGAFAVKTVQQLGERQKRMDEQLTKLRERAVKDVAVTAAKAPGDNRLAQAERIQSIIASTREIHGLIEQAKRETAEKFEIARQKLAQARQQLAELDGAGQSG
jgi:hypothetical protein